MKLQDVKHGGTYMHNGEECVLCGCHPHDGPYLIIEKRKDDDTYFIGVDASELTRI